jgi:hypothetical protein
MGWVISVGELGKKQNVNSAALAHVRCQVKSSANHLGTQWRFTANHNAVVSKQVLSVLAGKA